MARWICATFLFYGLTGCASIGGELRNPVSLVIEPMISSDPSKYGYSDIANVDPKVPWKDDSNFQTLSLYGREDLIARYSSDYQKTKCAFAPGLGGAMDEIERRARQTSIVIINESHVQSQHRDFIAKVALRLKPLGYSIYAAETFANLDDGIDPINENSSAAYFRVQDGHYLTEPSFGRLGRLLKQNNFEFAAYEDNSPWPEVKDWPEDMTPLIHQREEGQAENLMVAIFRKRPNAKVIIHVGYSHAKEEKAIGRKGKETTWMAARLKAKTGIDPLTITQTECRGGSDNTRLSKLPADVIGLFDLAIDHPLPKYNRKRPAWRIGQGDIAIDIPESLKPKSGWHVIEARLESDAEDAVPMDRVAIRPNENVTLMLPSGRYKVRAVKVVRDSAKN